MSAKVYGKEHPENLALVTLEAADTTREVLERVLETHVAKSSIPDVQQVIDALSALTNDADAICLEGEF